MLKLSILLSKLDFSTMGDLRADLVGEAERLEGVEEVREVIKKECVKADAAPVKERKPLRDTRELPWYMLIKDGKRIFGSGCETWEKVKKIQLNYPDSRIAQVMAPDESGNCPTQYIDNVQLGCEIEWAIYGTVGKTWLFPLHTNGYTWGEMVRCARRFTTKADAQSYIAVNHITAAIPFPVPKLREAE